MNAFSHASRRWKPLAIAVVLIGCVALLPRLVAQDPEPPLEWQHLDLKVSAQPQAGKPFEVTVRGAPDGAVTLYIDAGIGGRTLHADSDGGRAQFIVEPSPLPEAGLVTLTATSGRHIGQATTELSAASPARPEYVFVGSRTQSAASGESTMAVVIPTDRFGNTLADGTRVSVRNERPNRSSEWLAPDVESMLAWTWLNGGRRAGRADVMVSVNGDFGPRRSYHIVPADPAPFGLQLESQNPTADGSMSTMISTDTLVDPWGNELLDGTLATLVIESPDGLARLQSVVIDAAARFSVAAPTMAGDSTFRVEVGSTASLPLTVSHRPVALAIETTWVGGLLVIGPVVDDGHPVPDATMAKLIVDGELTDTVQLLDGMGVVEPDLPDRSEVEVEVLGVTSKVPAP